MNKDRIIETLKIEYDESSIYNYPDKSVKFDRHIAI
jgi:hypothetical protein